VLRTVEQALFLILLHLGFSCRWGELARGRCPLRRTVRSGSVNFSADGIVRKRCEIPGSGVRRVPSLRYTCDCVWSRHEYRMGTFLEFSTVTPLFASRPHLGQRRAERRPANCPAKARAVKLRHGLAKVVVPPEARENAQRIEVQCSLTSASPTQLAASLR